MDLQRSPGDGPLAWLLAGHWVGRGALVPSNPPSAFFPAAWRGHGALVLAGLLWTILSQFIRARKGAESGSRECETPREVGCRLLYGGYSKSRFH